MTSASSQASSSEAIVVFDIDGVIRDVGNSYRRALADTVEHFTGGACRPSQTEIDALKAEGIWNNDWEASQELVYRYFEAHPGQPVAVSGLTAMPAGRGGIQIDYPQLVAFFQARYRGPDPTHWTGYICQEPLLLQPSYLDSLTQAGIGWGFFSGATQGSARYVLETRLGLQSPVLIAMEDAPGKPDPTGLLDTVRQLEATSGQLGPVFYAGDTVADMYTVLNASQQQPQRQWIGIGVLPPHVQTNEEQQQSYTATLQNAGAQVVIRNIQELTPALIQTLVQA